jgi:transposase InsO family protein
LLRNLVITRVNQAWSTDITYIRLTPGFVYLVAIMDWFSRYVLSWEVSITLKGLGAYFEFYNSARLHQGLGYKTPAEVYRNGQ